MKPMPQKHARLLVNAMAALPDCNLACSTLSLTQLQLCNVRRGDLPPRNYGNRPSHRHGQHVPPPSQEPHCARCAACCCAHVLPQQTDSLHLRACNGSTTYQLTLNTPSAAMQRTMPLMELCLAGGCAVPERDKGGSSHSGAKPCGQPSNSAANCASPHACSRARWPGGVQERRHPEPCHPC